ncbi:MAG: shikimate kinase [Duncaniella sp.]|nr:shikimate kinase [Duncaniella sp.]
MKPIFIIGYMASGKSTLGRALADRFGIDFVDLDEWIESDAGMTVSGIFAAEGEEGFRRREREALMTLATGAAENRVGRVIACGGGTPCFGDNMEVMNACGLTVWLKPSRERLMNRLREGRSTRPLIASLSDDELEAFADTQLGLRASSYGRATETFDSSMLENEAEIEATSQRFYNRFLSRSL